MAKTRLGVAGRQTSTAEDQRRLQASLQDTIATWAKDPSVLAALPDDEKAKIAMRSYRPPQLDADIEETMLSLSQMIEDSYEYSEEWANFAKTKLFIDLMKKKMVGYEFAITSIKREPVLAKKTWEYIKDKLAACIDARRNADDLAALLDITPRQMQEDVESRMKNE